MGKDRHVILQNVQLLYLIFQSTLHFKVVLHNISAFMLRGKAWKDLNIGGLQF